MADTTPLPRIIPDSSSSAAVAACDHTSASNDDATSRPIPVERAKRVYGGGVKRIFASASTADEEEGREVIPETVETAHHEPRTVQKEAREKVGTSSEQGRSSPSPVVSRKIGMGLLPGLKLANSRAEDAEDEAASSSSSSEDEDEEMEDFEERKMFQGRKALQGLLDAIDNNSSPPRPLAPPSPLVASKAQPCIVSLGSSTSDLTPLPPAEEDSSSSDPSSQGDMTLKTTDTLPTSDADGDVEMAEATQLPTAKKARKARKVLGSDDSDDSGAGGEEDEDELPSAERVLDDEVEKRRRRKEELEARAKEAAKRRAAEREGEEGAQEQGDEGEEVDSDDDDPAVRKKGKKGRREKERRSDKGGKGKGRKKSVAEPDDDEDIEALGKAKKSKSKGLSKKDREDLERSLAKVEREQAFRGIASGTRDTATSLSTLLSKWKAPPSTSTASTTTHPFAHPSSAAAPFVSKRKAKLPSSPIEEGFSSQSRRRGEGGVIELESGTSSQTAPAKPMFVDLGDSSASEAEAAPPPPTIWKPVVQQKGVDEADAYDSDELPDGDAAFDIMKKRAEEEEASKRKAEALRAQKEKALLATKTSTAAPAKDRPVEDSDEEDSDIDIVGAPQPTTKALTGRTPRRTDTFERLHQSRGAKVVGIFADEKHRKPRRHDSKGFLTESNLPSHTQIWSAGKEVHLRGQDVKPSPLRKDAGAGATKGKKAPVRGREGKSGAVIDNRTLDQKLLAQHRNQAAHVRSEKEAKFVARGGKLFEDRERERREKRERGEGEEERVKAALEGAKERAGKGGEEEEEEDGDDGEWKEGGDEEEEETRGSGSEAEGYSGEGEGSEEEEGAVFEDGEDGEDAADDDSVTAPAVDENADPRSLSTGSNPSMAPTDINISGPSTARQPFSQLPGYVSPPATPPSQGEHAGTPPPLHEIALPGFAFPGRAGTESDDGRGAGLAFSQSQAPRAKAFGSPPAEGGFTQFFGASFTQEVGKRVGEKGFAQASLGDLQKEGSQCLLPAVDVLPEEYERDAIKLGAAGIFREATPEDHRPELYLNDEGMLTQSKPAPIPRMAATPMSQMSMHTPFGLRKQATISDLNGGDEESQDTVGTLPRPKHRLMRGGDEDPPRSAESLRVSQMPPPRQRSRNRLVVPDPEDDASTPGANDDETGSHVSREPVDGDAGELRGSQAEMRPPPVPERRNAFATLMDSRKRASSVGAENPAKKKTKKGRSDFVDDAASESEDEFGMGIAGDNEKDDDSDGEDGHHQVEGLVEDAPVDAEEQARQDALAAEKAKRDEVERDAKLQKQVEDVVQGKVRKRQKQGDDWDSDSEDDEEYARNEVNKHANKKRVRADGHALEALAANERTAAFVGAYKEGTLAHDPAEDNAFLQAPTDANEPGSDEDDEDGYGQGASGDEYDDDFVINDKKKSRQPQPMADVDMADAGVFAAGASSSPKQTISYRISANLSYGQVGSRPTPRAGGQNFGAMTHDDLDHLYDSQRYNSLPEAMLKNVAATFGDELQNDGGRRAGKNSSVTAFTRQQSTVGKKSSAALDAAKGLSKSHAGAKASQARADLMQPNRNPKAGMVANIRKAKSTGPK